MHLPRWKRWCAVFDNHGDMIDRTAEKAFFSFLDIWKPQRKIHGGDNWDFRCLRKGASEDERRESIDADLNTGNSFLERYRPDEFLLGNHCNRLWEWAKYGGGPGGAYALNGTIEIEKMMKGMKCRLIPWGKRKGVVTLGNYKVIHGYATGIGAARKSAICYGNVLLGHGHQIQVASLENHEGSMGRMCGCLCLLDHDYNRGQLGTLAQHHGWVYGLESPSGQLLIQQAQCVDGIWILPSEGL